MPESLTPSEMRVLHLVQDHGGYIPYSEFDRELYGTAMSMLDRHILENGNSKEDHTSGFAIGVAGENALLMEEQAAKEKADQRAEKDAQEAKSEGLVKKNARRSWCQFFLGLILGWVLGCFTPIDLWKWLSALFH